MDNVNGTHIGAGGFGTVYHSFSHPEIAVKICKYLKQASTLDYEFRVMNQVFSTSQDSTAHNSLFIIPTPHAIFHPTQPCQIGDSSSKTFQELTRSFAELSSPHPAYAMDRIPVLPSTLSDIIFDIVAPEGTKRQRIAMCRLYFGRKRSCSRFFNTRNCPIDIDDYRLITEAAAAVAISLPSAAIVCSSMGNTFGTVASSGYDCNDMEFTLAGSQIDPNKANLYAFDFDKMKQLVGTMEEQIDLLVASFTRNDPYFPRFSQEATLFAEFKKGFLQALQVPNSISADLTSRVLEPIDPNFSPSAGANDSFSQLDATKKEQEQDIILCNADRNWPTVVKAVFERLEAM